MINIGAAALTIDSPLSFFWLAAVGAWCLALFRRNGAEPRAESGAAPAVPRRAWAGWWYVGGLCASIGFLAKFTALFLLPGLLLFLLISKEDRRWLRTPHPYGALLAGLLGFLPFIVWNHEHGWVTVHHLMALGGAGRRRLFDPKATPMFFLQTAAVLSPIIFCFLVYGIATSTKLALRGASRAHLFCQVFVWPVLIFYAFVVLHKQVPVNWPFTSYLTGMIVTGAILAERLAAQREAERHALRRWIVAGVRLGFVISLALRFPFIYYPMMNRFGIPASTDHAAKMFLGYHEIGARVSEGVREMAAKDGHEPFIFSDNYRLASEIGFYSDKHYPNYCINVGQRHNQYDFWPGFEGKLGQNAICVREDLLQRGGESDEALPIEELKNAFARVAPPESFLIKRMGVPVKRFEIYRCYNFKDWKPPEKKRKY